MEGYNQVTLADALEKELGDRLTYDPRLEEAEPEPDPRPRRWRAPRRADLPPDEQAVRDAGLVIVAVSTYDREGRDRDFTLPADQQRLVELCTSLNDNTIVVVMAGGGVDMTGFVDDAAAIVYPWFAGQSQGAAIADVLTGRVNPSGKLPITIERSFEHSPGYGYQPPGYTANEREDAGNYELTYDVLYSEGVFVGYRWYDARHVEPLFCFGYGLSYSSFEYSDLKLSTETLTGLDPLTVSFTITNTSDRAGAEVAQLYIADVWSSVPRPIKELKGFARVELEPGQSKQVTLTIDRDDLSFWSEEAGGWVAEPGEFEVLVGASSRDIRLEGSFDYQR